MSMKDYLVINYYDSSVYIKDLLLLEGPFWLNDTLIGFYMDYLENEQFKTLNICFIRPEVTQCLKLSNEIGIFLDPLQFNNKDYAIMALNDCITPNLPGGTHWSLLIFCKDDNKFYHIDSLAGRNNEAAKNLSFKIAMYINTDEQCYYQNLRSLQQGNNYDCGLFVLCNMDNVLYHISNNETIANMELVTISQVSNKRIELKRLIINLYKIGLSKDKKKVESVEQTILKKLMQSMEKQIDKRDDEMTHCITCKYIQLTGESDFPSQHNIFEKNIQTMEKFEKLNKNLERIKDNKGEFIQERTMNKNESDRKKYGRNDKEIRKYFESTNESICDKRKDEERVKIDNYFDKAIKSNKETITAVINSDENRFNQMTDEQQIKEAFDIWRRKIFPAEEDIEVKSKNENEERKVKKDYKLDTISGKIPITGIKEEFNPIYRHDENKEKSKQEKIVLQCIKNIPKKFAKEIKSSRSFHAIIKKNETNKEDIIVNDSIHIMESNGRSFPIKGKEIRNLDGIESRRSYTKEIENVESECGICKGIKKKYRKTRRDMKQVRINIADEIRRKIVKLENKDIKNSYCEDLNGERKYYHGKEEIVKNNSLEPIFKKSLNQRQGEFKPENIDNEPYDKIHFNHTEEYLIGAEVKEKEENNIRRHTRIEEGESGDEKIKEVKTENVDVPKERQQPKEHVKSEEIRIRKKFCSQPNKESNEIKTAEELRFINEIIKGESTDKSCERRRIHTKDDKKIEEISDANIENYNSVKEKVEFNMYPKDKRRNIDVKDKFNDYFGIDETGKRCYIKRNEELPISPNHKSRENFEIAERNEIKGHPVKSDIKRNFRESGKNKRKICKVSEKYFKIANKSEEKFRPGMQGNEEEEINKKNFINVNSRRDDNKFLNSKEFSKPENKREIINKRRSIIKKEENAYGSPAAKIRRIDDGNVEIKLQTEPILHKKRIYSSVDKFELNVEKKIQGKPEIKSKSSAEISQKGKYINKEQDLNKIVNTKEFNRNYARRSKRLQERKDKNALVA